ncbi:MAG TPA: hypothetical protein V6C97_33805 [Oculatellaceae cyanobacterium]
MYTNLALAHDRQPRASSRSHHRNGSDDRIRDRGARKRALGRVVDDEHAQVMRQARLGCARGWDQDLD